MISNWQSMHVQFCSLSLASFSLSLLFVVAVSHMHRVHLVIFPFKEPVKQISMARWHTNYFYLIYGLIIHFFFSYFHKLYRADATPRQPFPICLQLHAILQLKTLPSNSFEILYNSILGSIDIRIWFANYQRTIVFEVALTRHYCVRSTTCTQRVVVDR